MRILYNLVTNGQINSIGVNYLAALARCRSNILGNDQCIGHWLFNGALFDNANRKPDDLACATPTYKK